MVEQVVNSYSNILDLFAFSQAVHPTIGSEAGQKEGRGNLPRLDCCGAAGRCKAKGSLQTDA